MYNYVITAIDPSWFCPTQVKKPLPPETANNRTYTFKFFEQKKKTTFLVVYNDTDFKKLLY